MPYQIIIDQPPYSRSVECLRFEKSSSIQLMEPPVILSSRMRALTLAARCHSFYADIFVENLLSCRLCLPTKQIEIYWFVQSKVKAIIEDFACEASQNAHALTSDYTWKSPLRVSLCVLILGVGYPERPHVFPSACQKVRT